METPIADFVRRYADSGMIRAHMPGHKGKPFLGCETLDITEIQGADSLYEAEGIIRRSESCAGELFGGVQPVHPGDAVSGADLRKWVPDGGGCPECTPGVCVRGGPAGF